MAPRIALTTYSVKPRGGVVHTVELAEALTRAGHDVTIVAMGDPAAGLYREVDADVHIVDSPPWQDTLEARVFSWIDTMTDGLGEIADGFDIIHSQDCISARAAGHVRRARIGEPAFTLIRTVHHVDDFTTQALIDCQRQAIIEPDVVLVVSETWRRILAADYGVAATVVTNGVRADRFTSGLRPDRHQDLRARLGPDDRFTFLSVGGIEPRKGSAHLIAALGRLKSQLGPAAPRLAVIGGHSFQDYAPYREEVLGSLDDHGLALGDDIILLGTVDDIALPEWFHAADAFVFPSVNEGFGLVILEAMAAGLPTVTSDLDVFREFLVDRRDVVMTRAADPSSLAAGMAEVMTDRDLAARLRLRGPQLAAAFPWEHTAAQHVRIYERAAAGV